MGAWGMNGWELIKAGGPLMAPILLCSLFAVAVMVEKLWYLSTLKGNLNQLKSDIFNDLKDNRTKEAVKRCEDHASPVAKILKAAILQSGTTAEEIKEAMESVSLYEIPRMEQRLGILSTIAHIAPLLGLLGTVIGLAESFHTIQVKATALNPISPIDLAGGIWEALITTVAGLLVAIPAYLAYNYCVSRTNGIVLEMERAATEMVNFLTQLSQTDYAKKIKRGEPSLEI